MEYVRCLVAVAYILCFMAMPLSADVIGKTNEEVKAIAEPVLDNILEGLRTDDCCRYLQDFDETLKESISERQFLDTDRKIENSIGNYQSREYLGFLTKGQMTVILWKARFDTSEDDVLIKLVISKREDRYLVTGLWFQ